VSLIKAKYCCWLLVLAALVACDNDEPYQPPPPVDPPPVVKTTISGGVYLGAIRNAVVTAYSFDNGSRGDVLATGRSDLQGTYTLSDVDSDQMVLVCASGEAGNSNIAYTEESSGVDVVVSANDELCAMVEASGETSHTAQITHFTHLAYSRAAYLIGTGMQPNIALSNSLQSVYRVINTNPVETPPLDPTDIANATSRHSQGLYYGQALAAVSQYTQTVSEQNQESPVHQNYHSLRYSQTAFEDIRYDGVLNGQGESGLLSFGQVPIDVSSYRHHIAMHLFVFVSSDRNVSGLDAIDYKGFGERINSATDDIFGGAPVVPFSGTEPIITNVSVSDGQTVFQTTTISADVTAIYGLDRVEFRLDGALLDGLLPGEPLSYDLDTTQYAEGDHTLVVRAVSQFGDETNQTINLVFDNEQTVVTNILPMNGTHVRGTFDFSATVSDPFGINNVHGIINNSVRYPNIGTTSPSVPFDSTLNADGSYLFGFRVVNGLDFTSDHEVTYTIDNTLPDASLINVNNMDTLIGSPSIQFAVSDTYLSQASVLLDGEIQQSFTTFSDPMAYSLDTTAFPDGEHVLAVTANDLAGNNRIASANVVIDNNPPVVNITNPVTNSVATAGFTVTANTSDTVGVVSTEYYVDTTLLSSATVDPSLFADGGHNVTVKAFDDAGHEGNDSIAVTFDTTLPTVSITNPTDASFLTSNFTITADISDSQGIASSSMTIDGQALASPDIVLTDYADGNYNIEVQATDTSGLQNSDSVTVFIDNTLPSVEVTAPTEGSVISGTLCIRAAVSDLAGIRIVEYLIDDLHLSYPPNKDIPFMCFTSDSFFNGPHVFTVKVWDNSDLVNSADVNVTISN